MINFQMTTDSGCDLPITVCRDLNIAVQPLSYTMGEHVFYDTMVPEDILEFYQKMREGASPKTSQLNVQEMLKFFREQAVNGVPILHFALGSGISGTYQNCLAARELLLQEMPQAEVYVLDTTLGAVGFAKLVLEAESMRQAGASFEETIRFLEDKKRMIHTCCITDDLTYLHRSGRVTKAGKIVARVLNICPVLDLNYAGQLRVADRVRGKNKAFLRMEEQIEKTVIHPETQTLYVCHSDCEEQALALGERLEKKFGFHDVYTGLIGPVIGSHTGPGMLSVFYEGIQRSE